MATWRPSNLAARVSGRLGGIEFAASHGRPIIRQAATWRPPAPGLDIYRADLVRQVLQVPPSDWPGGEAYWISLAQAATRVNRFGGHAPVTARQLWVHWATYYRAPEGIYVTDPPASPMRAPRPAAAPSGFNVGQVLALEVELPADITGGIAWFFVRLGKGFRRGYRRGRAYVGFGLQSPGTNLAGASVGEPVINRFGTLQAGNRLEIGAVIGYADGRMLPSSSRSGVITLAA